jgi:hypothetical protein
MNLAARIALLLFAVATASCDSPNSELDARELTSAAKSLASLSAEAQLLTRQWNSGDVTFSFALVHQDALQQESLKLAKQLAKPAPDDLRSAQERALALNARLQSGLVQIAKAPAQPAQLSQLEQDFQRVKTEAKALEPRP